MRKEKKEVKSSRLKKLEKKLGIIEKSQAYLEKELAKVRKTKEKINEKIRKEKKAILFINRAKKLRSSKKVKTKKKN